jgi:dienelactone hydrolase
MNRRIFGALAALVAVALGAGSGRTQAPEPPAAVKPRAVVEAERDLWRPGQARYLRRWQVKAATAPLADEAVLAPDGPDPAGWATNTAWSDQVALGDQAGADGTRQAPRYAYAFTTVDRVQAGPAELALGVQGPVKVWINGQPAGDAPGDAGFVYDGVRLPVQFKAGENRILLRIENQGGGWLMAARLLEPNQPLPDVRLQPAAWDQGGVLKVRTDIAPRTEPAQVTVLAPGGRELARATVRRGETASLPSGTWPDGPYDVRVASRDDFGQPLLAFAPGFKGDMTVAARQLLARAETVSGTGAEAGHWRMLRDLVVDRAGADLSRIGSAWGPVHSALMEAAEMALGPTAAVRPSGFVRLAWIDPIDGSAQFCRAYLPADYDPTRRWPVVLMLHGAHPAAPPYIRYWGVDSRHHPVADRWPVIWIEPHGRGRSGYIGLGEKDVLNCLEAARARFPVDPARTYLTGGSMGGMGTWRVATHNVDAFAAIAPVFGGADLRLHPSMGWDNPAADRPMERWIAESSSDFAGAEQLRNTPVFVHHGDQDQAADVRFSRHIVGLMQRWGYDVRYREHPGWGHEDLGETDEIVAWFLQHSRIEAPRQARIRAADLAAARAAWLRVDGAMVPLEMIEADAEFTGPGVLRLDTRNVARLTLTPPAVLRAGSGPLKVVWNGRPLEAAPNAAGQVSLVASDAPNGPLLKRPGLSGGVFDVFATPFVIVVGTNARDPEMRRMIRTKAEALADVWTAMWHARPRIVDDRQLTPEMEKSLSLVLIGGADDNSVARRLAARIPLKVARDAVTVDGRRFEAADAYAVMVRPSPQAQDRYLMTVAGTSPEGLFLWDPISALTVSGVGFGNPYDWVIADGRRPALAKGLAPDRGWVAAGVFDQAWRRDDRWTFLGDASLRAAAPLRRVPKAKIVLPAAVLDRYAGRYLYVGAPVTLTVRAVGGELLVDPPQGQSTDRLLPQSDTRFLLASNGAPVEIRLGPDGLVAEVVVDEGGQASTWRRVP